jgi:hypothetical protein
LLQQGYVHIVDADLKSYFDSSCPFSARRQAAVAA